MYLLLIGLIVLAALLMWLQQKLLLPVIRHSNYRENIFLN